MKTLLTLTTLVLIVISGIAALSLFEKGIYLFSALLITASYLSAALSIYIVTNKKVVLQ